MAIFSCERLRTCTQFDTMPQGLIYAPQSRNLWGVIFLQGSYEMSTAHDHAEGHEEIMQEYMSDLPPLERAQREQQEFSGKSERELLYEKIEIIGNGDLQQGLKLIEKLSERLTHAREKHNAAEWKSFPLRLALTKLQDELAEQKYAATYESLERAMDEGLDVMAVEVRILNKEFKQHLFRNSRGDVL